MVLVEHVGQHDGRRYDDAKGHMREAQALAEMSGDQAIKFRIWSHAGTMYRHMGRPAHAFAANDVARKPHITRRDPMFASLGLARQAAIQGAAQDHTATRLAHAQLAQGAADAATATAMTVPADAATKHARVSRMLQEFGAALRATAPNSPIAHTWTEHTHAAWRTTT